MKDATKVLKLRNLHPSLLVMRTTLWDGSISYYEEELSLRGMESICFTLHPELMDSTTACKMCSSFPRVWMHGI